MSNRKTPLRDFVCAHCHLEVTMAGDGWTHLRNQFSPPSCGKQAMPIPRGADRKEDHAPGCQVLVTSSNVVINCTCGQVIRAWDALDAARAQVPA